MVTFLLVQLEQMVFFLLVFLLVVLVLLGQVVVLHLGLLVGQH